MKNHFLFLTIFSVLGITVFAFISNRQKSNPENVHAPVAAKGIRFIEEDWSKAVTEAKKQNKLIFLDAYASWCGPCKLLKRKTFPDQSTGDFFNQHFINVAVDMEKGQGPALAVEYAVNAYPTLIITDTAGKVITYTKGFISPTQLIEFGKFGINQSEKNR